MRVMPRGGESRTHLNKEFDGDMMSLTCAFTEDAKEEIKSLLNDVKYYYGVTGRPTFSASNAVSDLVFAEMTN